MEPGKLERLQEDPQHFLDTIPPNRGCILEVDLEYPQELHNSHNDYPLAPENLNIQQNWLSETQLQIRTHYHMRGHEHNYKLLPHFFKRTKYVLHSEALKFYLAHGMKLVTVHRGISFRQSNWMQQYVQLNSTLRAAATNDFEKDFF